MSGMMENATTDAPTNETIRKCVDDTTVYIQVMGTLVFFVVWPLVVLDTKYFPLGRPAAAMLGAALMVLLQIVGQPEVYEIEGRMGNLQALFLLVGMMLLSYYFDREGLLRIIALWIFGKDKPFKYILFRVCILAGVLAAFITNDATSLVITPLLITELLKQGRSRKEILPLCLGIATSANIGSASTVFGNPQNAFIASAANIALIDFFIALLPAAIIGLAINGTMLHLLHWNIIFGKGDEEETEVERRNEMEMPETPGALADERASIALSYDQSREPHLTSQIAREREIIYSTEHLSASGSMHKVAKSRSRYSLRGSSPRPDAVKPSASNPNLQPNVPEIRVGDGADQVENGLKKYAEARHSQRDSEPPQQTELEARQEEGDDELVLVKGLMERTWREKIFAIWLVCIFATIVILLAIPPPPVTNAIFNLGLLPLGAAIFTMLVDTILNRRYAFDAMTRIDWTVVLMFMGLFTWLGGFQNTCIPEIIFDELSTYMNLNKVYGVIFFTVFVIIGSNIFSNVPLTILIVDRIGELCGNEECKGPLAGLLLAWVATTAGNFTLIGSITNLIVAEKARSTGNYRITFIRYLRFGFVTTLLVIFIPLPIVYFLGKVA